MWRTRAGSRQRAAALAALFAAVLRAVAPAAALRREALREALAGDGEEAHGDAPVAAGGGAADGPPGLAPEPAPDAVDGERGAPGTRNEAAGPGDVVSAAAGLLSSVFSFGDDAEEADASPEQATAGQQAASPAEEAPGAAPASEAASREADGEAEEETIDDAAASQSPEAPAPASVGAAPVEAVSALSGEAAGVAEAAGGGAGEAAGGEAGDAASAEASLGGGGDTGEAIGVAAAKPGEPAAAPQEGIVGWLLSRLGSGVQADDVGADVPSPGLATDEPLPAPEPGHTAAAATGAPPRTPSEDAGAADAETGAAPPSGGEPAAPPREGRDAPPQAAEHEAVGSAVGADGGAPAPAADVEAVRRRWHRGIDDVYLPPGVRIVALSTASQGEAEERSASRDALARRAWMQEWRRRDRYRMRRVVSDSDVGAAYLRRAASPSREAGGEPTAVPPAAWSRFKAHQRRAAELAQERHARRVDNAFIVIMVLVSAGVGWAWSFLPDT